MNNIGYQDGIFWYSSADHIEVPNISSMASNVFARSAILFKNNRYLDLANSFATYCIENQASSGAYPYFAQNQMVYFPYHALETWELKEANEILKSDNLEESIAKAVEYLFSFIKQNGFRSRTPFSKPIHSILLKTPVWAAKACLFNDNFDKALDYLSKSQMLFGLPNNELFYLMREIDLKLFPIFIPKFSSQYIRYNASFFEVGSLLLRTWNIQDA